MDITIGQIVDYAGKLTVTALLFLILYGGSKGWWVFGWQYRLKVAESEEWKRLALAGTQLAVKGLETATHATEKMGP